VRTNQRASLRPIIVDYDGSKGSEAALKRVAAWMAEGDAVAIVPGPEFASDALAEEFEASAHELRRLLGRTNATVEITHIRQEEWASSTACRDDEEAPWQIIVSVRTHARPWTRLFHRWSLVALFLVMAGAAGGGTWWWGLRGDDRSTPKLAAAGAAAPSETRAEHVPVVAASRPTRSVFKLVATRGDCWVLVRAADHGGVLWQGILRRGSSLRFPHETLQIRAGAWGNIAVMFNGKPVPNLPLGTADVVLRRASRPIVR